jgi:hypothetical protein
MTNTRTFNESRFRMLLDRWNDHQALRDGHAEVAVLATSRRQLDAARLAAYPGLF